VRQYSTSLADYTTCAVILTKAN